MLKGLRTKVYVKGGVEFCSAGPGFSWSSPGASGVITGVSYHFGIGLSLFGPVGIVTNKGYLFLPKNKSLIFLFNDSC
jgi:hypothetical protein